MVEAMSEFPSLRLHRALHGITAGALFAVAFVVGWRLEIAIHLGALREPLAALGMIVLLLAFLGHRPAVRRWSTRLCLLILTGLLAVAVTEVFFRAIRFDFRFQRAFWERTPPNWRRPIVPTGTVFFRHEGNVVWTGRVLPAYLDIIHLSADAYADVPPLTLRYDRFGFRNEPRPEAWEIVVAGDSFTELGDVPYDRLFTTLLARGLDCRVLNLGVGDTGPLTQLSYLRDYGLSPVTRDVVMVFFEGNDLWDLIRERAAEKRFAETGRREYREFVPQSSFLRAVGELLKRPAGANQRFAPRVDAWFQGREGEVPVTLGLPPPGRAELAPELFAALDNAFRRYAEFARAHHLRARLAFMPCKLRVLHGHLRFAPEADDRVRNWTPGDLPEVIAAFCATNHIRFLDLTPALAAHTAATGELLYNHLYDVHLNARGSEVVAETLIRDFRETGW